MMRTAFVLLLLYNSVIYAQSPRLMPPIGHTNTITSFSFSKDGKFMVTGSEDKTVKIWDLISGKLLQDFKEFSSKVTGVAFHPDSRSVIASSDEGKLCEWDIYSGKLLNTITNKEGMSVCAFSNDGKYMAVVFDYRFDNPEIILYDHKQNKIISRTAAHKEHIHRLAFSKDNKYIVSASYDNTLKVLEVPGLSEKAKIKFPESQDIEIKSFSVDALEKTIMLVHRSKGLMFYGFPALNLIKTHKPENVIYSARYSNDGSMIVTGGGSGTFSVWNTTPLILAKTYKSTDPNEIFGMDHAAFNNNDSKIFTVSAFVGFGKMYDRRSGKLLYNTSGSAVSLSNANFSLGGALVATGSADGFVKIWSGTSGRFLYNITGHKSLVSSAAFSYKGDYIASGSWDHTANIWDWTTKKLVRSFKLHGDVDHVELNHDNTQLLAQIFKDSFVYVWDVAASNLQFKLAHPAEVDYASFSFDGKLIATGARDGFVRIWDAKKGLLLKELKAHDHFITSVNFHISGRLLISSSIDSTAKVWDVESGNCLATLRGHSNYVNYATLSMYNGLALTASSDKTAKLWQIESGKCLATIEGHSDALISASFSTYDNRVITLSKDNSFKIWDGKTGNLLATSFAFGTNDFFTVSPEGYFFCSPAAARKVHYVTGDLKPIPFDQLDLKYNRPDKLMEIMGHRNTTLIEAYKNAYLKRIKKAGIDTLIFSQKLSVPVAEIVNASSIPLQQDQAKLTLHIRAADENVHLAKMNIWIDEVPVFGMQGIDLKNRKIKNIDTTIVVVLSDSTNIIETSVINTNGTESFRSPVTVNFIPLKPSPVKTYFFGIGINNYKEPGHDLSWSVKDIRDLSGKLRSKYGSSLSIDTLFNESVTRNNVLALRKKLAKLTVNDRVIFAFSGHGLLSKNFDYYLSTYTINFENPDADNEGLLYDDLEKMFDGIAPRKKLMLIDACHSGEIDKEETAMTDASKEELESKGIKGVTLGKRPTKKAGSANSFEILQQFFANVSRSTGTTVISAAAGTQYALERGDIRNGVFTYCIIDAMNKYPSMNVQLLKRIVTAKVVELTNGLQRPNSRTETNINDWRVW